VDARANERHRSALDRACAGADSGEALFAEAATRLRRLVEFDGSAWFATDPETVMATSPIRIENVEQGHCETFWERECLVEDAILFRDLARSDAGVATLYEATDDHPARSTRYREFLRPQGYEDELRAALRINGNTWGLVDLYRDRARGPFTSVDVRAVRSVVPAIAAALRRLAARTPVRADGAADDVAADGPGTALFDGIGRCLGLDERAERWFTELAGPSWSVVSHSMTPIAAVVARAGAIHTGFARGAASARLRTPSGRWLSVHASCLRGHDGRAGPTALTIEPAKSAQIAPIIVEAYGLTQREQQITRAVARGLSNPEIGVHLSLSAHTVRDHLKAIFAKTGVTSRGELVAKLFADHYAPAMHDPRAEYTHVDI
jgi:DNA-binding CsgD family transcriptional regulator